MFAKVRQFSSLSRVLHSSAKIPPFRSQPTKMEMATLNLLEDTSQKQRIKPLTEAAQRYQKIHSVGDIYHPEDLNDARYRESLQRRRGKPTPTEDPFEVLGLDPLHEYKNYKLLTHFVSDMGKILPRERTGVSAKNQRKLAKAIKRARAMGLLSSTSNQTDFVL